MMQASNQDRVRLRTTRPFRLSASGGRLEPPLRRSRLSGQGLELRLYPRDPRDRERFRSAKHGCESTTAHEFAGGPHLTRQLLKLLVESGQFRFEFTNEGTLVARSASRFVALK